MEQKIIDYLVRECEPEVILLGGSRSKGRETKESDWDLILIGNKKGKSGFIEFEDQLLDITFKDWPEENKPLPTPYGPLWPAKVLLDQSKGKLQKVLNKNEEDFNKGSLALYREAIVKRLKQLESWKRKMDKYAENSMVEFFYAGIFYEIAIRLWLEGRNKWSLPPSEALPIIQNEDKEFYDLLSLFTSTSPIQRISITKDILERLEKTLKSNE